MSAEENKAAFRRLPEDVFNSGNLDLLDELVSSDYVERQPAPPGWPRGLEGFKMFVTTLRTAFPDVHCTVEKHWGNGDDLGVMQQLGAVPELGEQGVEPSH
jgi:hypothetical protein